MYRAIFFIIATSVPVFLAPPALAETSIPAEDKCPIGGQTYTYLEYLSFSRWGVRLDGKPYGSAKFPLHLSVCPNGFIAFKKEFTPDELKKYADIIARPEFKKLSASETTYYALAYLKREGGESPVAVLDALQQATWQADEEPARFKRYQEEFIRDYDTASSPLNRDEPPYWMFGFYSANAERQLGLFDAAAARTARLRREMAGKTIVEQNMTGRLDLLDRLITAKDASLEPEALKQNALPPGQRQAKP